MASYDFSGWATKNDLLCADGRIIRENAFAGNDGDIVPLVWMHKHDSASNVLGHAILMNTDSGVYTYGTFNNTREGQKAKALVEHGDISSLSIYANELQQDGGNVLSGNIREVSLVLSGANPGAKIENVVLAHGDDISFASDEAVIYTDEPLFLAHSADYDYEEDNMDYDIQDVIDTMDDDQLDALDALVDAALEEGANQGYDEGYYDGADDGYEDGADDGYDEGYDDGADDGYDEGYDAGADDGYEDDGYEDDDYEEDDMKHNLFDVDAGEGYDDVLMHSAMNEIIGDAKSKGSLRESFLAHADDYGIDNIEYLFPDVKALSNTPEFISREMSWVTKVMGATKHVPFSRIKTTFADITEEEARAKGYIKGKLKKEEVFSLLKRSTTPTTVYKKQKMDKDDIVDITDFDVIAWLKTEMRMMLDEEIARAILIGDGRLTSDDDHISEDHIRPIVNEADLFVIRWSVAAGSDSDAKAKNFIRCAIKSRKNYKGSGNPSLYTTEDMLTDMLLLEDTIGHKLYKTEAELATALRVKEIVTVPVMENFKDKDSKDVYGIIMNLQDYSVGADKGGSINMFEDFDIDYNQQKYLIETRCSGAITKPFSAIVLRSGSANASEEPGIPTAKAALTA